MKSRTLICLLIVFLTPQVTHAVLPPDIIFSLGTQLWQIVVGVGALVVGSITAMFPFFQGASGLVPRARVVLLSLGIFGMLGGLTYLLFIVQTKPGVPATSQSEMCTSSPMYYVNTSASSTFAFYSDRFLFSGTRIDGTPILVNLILNRKQMGDGSFLHYYLGNLLDGTKQKKISFERNALGHDVLPDLLFSRYKRSTSTDHSAREKFMMEFRQFDLEYKFATGELISDFITKNEPEYTAYVTVGTSSLNVDGESVVLNMMHERVYSTDYRPTIFFEGSGLLPAETIQLIFWDELGNFYLVDKSVVNAFSPAYSSHYWALTKDQDGYAKRGFNGEAKFEYVENMPRFFAHVPEFANATFVLNLERVYKGDVHKGLVSGVVTDALGTRKIVGQGYFHIYGEE